MTRLFEKPGDTYKDYTCLRIEPIEELRITFVEVQHQNGAIIHHIQSEDDENVFTFSFKTPATSSDGVAHILEHSVLCGSSKYPVKDPFFGMIRRSLNTFMNAFTGPDYTCYPAATQNEKDFYNLFDVYIDAAFFPKLRELSFLQEGHRLEFVQANDPHSELRYGGVVYNEMKGDMASINSRIYHKLMENLFPDNAYRFNSGGDPKVIPDLSYDSFLKFHEDHYAPSRAYFYLYGNIPLKNHLDFLQSKLFNGAAKLSYLPNVPLQRSLKKPLQIADEYPIEEGEEEDEKCAISFAWLTCSQKEQEEMLALTLLMRILMETDASYLKRALLQSKKCKSATMFLETELVQAPAILILKGCKKEDQADLLSIIETTLEKCVTEGLNEEMVNACLHRLKFDRLELDPDYGPYGLSLFFRSTLLQQQGGDAVTGLQVHALFEKLEKTLEKNPKFLPDLIKKYFLENNHRVDLSLEPSTTLLKKEKTEEKERLKKIEDTLSEVDKEKIVAQSKALHEFQEAKDDLSCLPMIAIKDIATNPKRFDLFHEKRSGFEVFAHTEFTSKITYFEAAFALPSLTEEELGFVQLFTDFLTEMGTKDKPYQEWLEETQKYAGEITSFLQINPSVYDPNSVNPTLHIHAKALDENVPKLFALVKELIESPDFSNKERLKELLIQEHTSMQMSINQNALGYATSLGSSGLNQSAFINEKWSGLNYFWFLQNLLNNFDHKADEIIDTFYKLHEKLIKAKPFDLILGCDEQSLTNIQQSNFFGLKAPKNAIQEAFESNYELVNPLSQARMISSGVFFTSQIFTIPNFADPTSALLSIGSILMENGYLHPHIREKGGAYGGGARASTSMGYLNFFGYRDPKLSKTIDHFEKAIEMLCNGEFTQEQIDEAKRIVIQKLDSPVYPPHKATKEYALYLQKRSKDLEKTFRDVVLQATKEQIIEAAKSYLQNKSKVTITFGSKEILEKENKILKTPLPSFPV